MINKKLRIAVMPLINAARWAFGLVSSCTMVEISKARAMVPYITPTTKAHRAPSSKNPIRMTGMPNKKAFQMTRYKTVEVPSMTSQGRSASTRTNKTRAMARWGFISPPSTSSS
jgi:hypothetical protein